jgi:hypothetical protein
MTALFSYLLTFFGIAFWFFRAIATLLYQLQINFFTQPINVTYEIVILFATIPCLLLVIKRNIIGAVVYMAIYVTYFGTSLMESFTIAQSTGFNIVNSSDMLCTLVGCILPILIFFDVLLNKNRSLGVNTKSSDWFYKNEQFDRNFDERADRNQYRIR